MTQRIASLNRAIGPDLDQQPVEVSCLLNTRILDDIINLGHRRENRINRNFTDRQSIALVSWQIATTTLDRHLDLQMPIVGIECANIMVWVDKFDVAWRINIARANNPRTLLRK